ncbi:MAG: hypothetical protein JF599_03765 [Verrucomicrobia bacterium]|nr:hypothetical protein [Verrucomicrobiota bacterium]
MSVKHSALHPAAEPLEAVISASEALVKEALAQRQKRKAVVARNARTQTRATLADAPRWSALVEACTPHLQKHGARNQLARHLGVTRQCICHYFTSRTARPDAERTLMILEWLAASRAGHDPAP